MEIYNYRRIIFTFSILILIVIWDHNTDVYRPIFSLEIFSHHYCHTPVLERHSFLTMNLFGPFRDVITEFGCIKKRQCLLASRPSLQKHSRIWRTFLVWNVYNPTCHVVCLPFLMIRNYTRWKKSEETWIVSRNVSFRVSSNERPEFCVHRQSGPALMVEKPTDMAQKRK